MSVLLRVTQLNAVYLDKEILNALLHILRSSTNYLPADLLASYESELDLILQLAVLKYSVLKNGSTFGQQLLSIRYEEISTLKRLLYFTPCFLRYTQKKLEHWKPSHEINNIIHKVFIAVKLFDFVNFTLFLCRGTKPLLVERILGLNQVYNDGSTARVYSAKYFSRELLWNSFIEIMVHVIPLINFHKLKRF
ncbi:hypothetical protein HHI36_004451 [Cryptolaemus montrouzieri]|uniref:RING-type E3 ubiquitin transferase (cysteine targeting) n=1 Tax=Cryptolaemus montrouzieri TaxID=559131 RepID=A0ABD2NRX3_9CUCU